MPSLSDTVVLDSNAMTYLDEATDRSYQPDTDSSDLCQDRVALFRLYLHLESTPWITPAIEAEYERIKEQSRLRSHTLLAYAFLHEVTDPLNTSVIEARVEELLKSHNSEKDCRVILEAEAFGADVVLSCDRDLLRNLGQVARVALYRPRDYWDLLAVPRGRRPPREPLVEATDLKKWWTW